MLDKVRAEQELLEEFGQEMAKVQNPFPARINASPDKVEQGLAKLVLTVIELVRRLLEQQAIRRMENNSLSEDEIERIGSTLLQLEVKMEELKTVFCLSGEDLNIDLGPLGNLI